MTIEVNLLLLLLLASPQSLHFLLAPCCIAGIVAGRNAAVPISSLLIMSLILAGILDDVLTSLQCSGQEGFGSPGGICNYLYVSDFAPSINK